MSFDFILSFTNILKGFGNAVMWFMSSEINLLGLTMTPLEIFAGGGFAIIIVAVILKAVVPFL